MGGRERRGREKNRCIEDLGGIWKGREQAEGASERRKGKGREGASEEGKEKGRKEWERGKGEQEGGASAERKKPYCMVPTTRRTVRKTRCPPICAIFGTKAYCPLKELYSKAGAPSLPHWSVIAILVNRTAEPYSRRTVQKARRMVQVFFFHRGPLAPPNNSNASRRSLAV